MNEDDEPQMEFNLDSAEDNEAGYNAWREERKQKYARIVETWHLPIHERVRVKLKCLPGELEGALVIREFPTRLTTKIPLKLRVDSWEFDSSEIEYCCMLDLSQKKSKE